MFSSLADGYESLLTPQSILTMTPADLDALAGQQVTAPSGTAGKLITSDRWYFAAAVSEEEALRLSKESSVTARFSGSFSQDVPMTLEQVGEAVDGRAVVVLSSNRYLSQITLLRGQTVELIFGSSSGLRVPKAALRMVTQESTDPETGETVQTNLVGVYTLVGGRAEFKPVEHPHRGVRLLCGLPRHRGARPSCGRGTRSSSGPPGSMTGQLLNFWKGRPSGSPSPVEKEGDMHMSIQRAGPGSPGPHGGRGRVVRPPTRRISPCAPPPRCRATTPSAPPSPPGITLCGENRVQELTAHLAAGAYEGAQVHFIGHLQTNKVKQVVGQGGPDPVGGLGASAPGCGGRRRTSWAWFRTSCWR